MPPRNKRPLFPSDAVENQYESTKKSGESSAVIKFLDPFDNDDFTFKYLEKMDFDTLLNVMNVSTIYRKLARDNVIWEKKYQEYFPHTYTYVKAKGAAESNSSIESMSSQSPQQKAKYFWFEQFKLHYQLRYWDVPRSRVSKRIFTLNGLNHQELKHLIKEQENAPDAAKYMGDIFKNPSAKSGQNNLSSIYQYIQKPIKTPQIANAIFQVMKDYYQYSFGSKKFEMKGLYLNNEENELYLDLYEWAFRLKQSPKEIFSLAESSVVNPASPVADENVSAQAAPLVVTPPELQKKLFEYALEYADLEYLNAIDEEKISGTIQEMLEAQPAGVPFSPQLINTLEKELKHRVISKKIPANQDPNFALVRLAMIRERANIDLQMVQGLPRDELKSLAEKSIVKIANILNAYVGKPSNLNFLIFIIKYDRFDYLYLHRRWVAEYLSNKRPRNELHVIFKAIAKAIKLKLESGNIDTLLYILHISKNEFIAYSFLASALKYNNVDAAFKIYSNFSSLITADKMLPRIPFRNLDGSVFKYAYIHSNNYAIARFIFLLGQDKEFSDELLVDLFDWAIIKRDHVLGLACLATSVNRFGHNHCVKHAEKAINKFRKKPAIIQAIIALGFDASTLLLNNSDALNFNMAEKDADGSPELRSIFLQSALDKAAFSVSGFACLVVPILAHIRFVHGQEQELNKQGEKISFSEFLASQKIYLTWTDKSQRTYLHYIASITCRDSQKLLQELLNAGVNINALDSKGRSALYYAIQAENEQAVKFLLEQGARVDCSNLCSFVMQASKLKSHKGNINILTMLINYWPKNKENNYIQLPVVATAIVPILLRVFRFNKKANPYLFELVKKMFKLGASFDESIAGPYLDENFGNSFSYLISEGLTDELVFLLDNNMPINRVFSGRCHMHPARSICLLAIETGDVILMQSFINNMRRNNIKIIVGGRNAGKQSPNTLHSYILRDLLNSFPAVCHLIKSYKESLCAEKFELAEKQKQMLLLIMESYPELLLEVTKGGHSSLDFAEQTNDIELIELVRACIDKSRAHHDSNTIVTDAGSVSEQAKAPASDQYQSFRM